MDYKVHDSPFFGMHEAESEGSAEIVLGALFKHLRPESVIHIGCGRGTWLRAARELGVGQILGVDGEDVEQEDLIIPLETFRAMDLSQPLEIHERFDLCLCLEVAEHLPFKESERFVRDLTTLSAGVLFSAAVPYQGGKGHINEQWPEFWALLFRRLGYSAHDLFRREVWIDERVGFWCAQNVLLFTRDGSAASDLAPE